VVGEADWVGGSFLNFTINGLKYTIQILINIAIPKPQNFEILI